MSGGQSILEKAGTQREFIGVDPQKYPVDLRSNVRYRDDLVQEIPDRYPLPSPLSLEQLDTIVDALPQQYPIQWIDE